MGSYVDVDNLERLLRETVMELRPERNGTQTPEAHFWGWGR